MRTYAYLTLDVFTGTRFGGNQLAVFHDASGLSSAEMQIIAGELNLSETIFLTAAEAPGEWRARIFTPAMELPFAGHPTIGAALALAELGHLTEEKTILHEQAGAVRVTVRSNAAGTRVATLTTPRLPERLAGELAGAEDLASMLGLAASDIGTIVPCGWSAGVPFTFISLREHEALDRASLDLGAWNRLAANSAAPHIVAYVADDAGGQGEVAVRMFAPAMGISEDPATGAAAAALAGLLTEAQAPGDGTVSWTVRQGAQMGRPSTIFLEADIASGAPVAVRVGGEAVLVSRAVMEIE